MLSWFIVHADDAHGQDGDDGDVEGGRVGEEERTKLRRTTTT